MEIVIGDWSVVVPTMLAVLALVVPVFVAVGLHVVNRIDAVRTSVLNATPHVKILITQYSGPSTGLMLRASNHGATVAYDLEVTIPGVGTVPLTGQLRPKQDVAPTYPLDRDHALFTTPLGDGARAWLTFADRFGLIYRLPITLAQSPRDDGRFNVGSPPAHVADPPDLTWRVLWSLRKRI